MHFQQHNNQSHVAQQNVRLINIKIDAFGAIERLLPQDLSLQFESEVLIADVLEYVTRAYPEASELLTRCSCALGEDIVPRQSLLNTDTTLVLLSPVAGG